MANLDSIARPYALAAFEYARDHDQLPAWKAFLDAAATLTKNEQIEQVLRNPEVTTEKVFSLFREVLQGFLDDARQNFLSILAQNKRLVVLREINALFNASYAALQKISQVRVVTAVGIEDEFRNKLTKSLTHRIHHEVNLHCEIDPAILGGAIIHIGDKVIDGSIRGQLNRMLDNLTS